MRKVNVTELRAHLPEYLSYAQEGTEIRITSHGQVIARLVPPVDTRTEANNALKALRQRCKIGDVISPLDEDWDANK